MSPRARLPLTMGPGMDRATGVAAANPERPRQSRNVYQYLGKVEARKGLAEAAALSRNGTPQDHIIGGHSLRAERIGLVVGYETTSRKVNVFRVASDGTSPDFVGTVWTLPSGAPLPQVSLAENSNRVFIAHDEGLGYRQPTVYYDSFSSSFLNTLVADLDGNGESPIKYRGVVRHLTYLFGWGFGSASEPRPELVRSSLPDDPTTFGPEAYFIAGQRGDPVVTCQPTAGGLLVFKESETYVIRGTGRSSFGIFRADPLYGCIAPRLAVSISGSVFFWSEEGPRLSHGAESEDLAIPLDLDAPDPAGLVAEGDLDDAFAEYLPERRVVLFVFGQRVYALSLWGGTPKWSYWELGAAPYCAFRLYGGTALPSLVGAPEFDDATGITETETTIEWTNVDPIGDELVEIWIDVSGAGSWEKKTTVAVSGETQSEEITELTAGTDYDGALRYRRGTSYSPNSSDSSDPSTWPAAQQGSFQTQASDAPTLDSATWSRTSSTQEQIALAWTNDDVAQETRIYRRKDGSAWSLIHTAAAGATSYDDVSDDEGLGDPNADWGEALYEYYLVHWNGTVETGQSNILGEWAGPNAPTFDQLTAPGGDRYDAYWTDNESSGEIEIYDNYDDAGGIVGPEANVLRVTVSFGTSPHSVDLGSQAAGVEVEVRLRAKQTASTIDDYSDYTPQKPVTIV